MLVILANTAEERKDIVDRWTKIGLHCTAVANVAEAAQLADEIRDIEAFIIFDSIDLVQLLAWPTMLLDVLTYRPVRMLVSERISRIERLAVTDRYTRVVRSETGAFNYIQSNRYKFAHSATPRFMTYLHTRYAEEQEAMSHDNLIDIAEAIRYSFAPGLRSDRKKQKTPKPKPPVIAPTSACPGVESSADIRKLAMHAAKNEYYQLLAVGEDVDEDTLRERALELRDRLSTFREKGYLKTRQHRSFHRIHVAIAESVYVLLGETADTPEIPHTE